MRSITAVRSFLVGAVITAGFLTGCRDVVTSPAARPEARPSAQRSINPGETIYTFAEVKQNGHSKVYRTKVNRARRLIEFETVAEEGINTTTSVQPACDETVLDGCDSNPDGGTGGIIYGELDIDGTVTDTIETPWDPSYSTAGEDGTEYHCASRVDDVHFHWKNHYFETEGESELLGYLPSNVAGVVKGRYWLPPGPWLSTDGRARIWSGTVDANCMFRYTLAFGIALIEYGSIWTYKFNGDYEELGFDASFASTTGGDATVFYSLAELRDADYDAYLAVKRWLELGECTEGWVIVIDGERVC
ncbi:MAG TPA: hypothetical protein VF771_02475 [Longimicrobiaceae bacterium]